MYLFFELTASSRRLSKENLKEKKGFVIEKKEIKSVIEVPEKYSAFTADNKNIYVASGSDKTIYCIDIDSGAVRWKFTDQRISAITCKPVVFKKQIIFSTPEQIFMLGDNGAVSSVKNIDNGPVYWPGIAASEGKLIIPAARNLIEYDGANFIPLDNFPDFSGQSYAAIYNNILAVSLLNEKKILLYDLVSRRIIWQSSNLQQRTFIEPLVVDNFVYIADSAGNLYKFNYSKEKQTPVSAIAAGSGIMTNLIYKNFRLKSVFHLVDIQ